MKHCVQTASQYANVEDVKPRMSKEFIIYSFITPCAIFGVQMTPLPKCLQGTLTLGVGSFEPPPAEPFFFNDL